VCASVRNTGDTAAADTGPVPAVVAGVEAQAAWDWYDKRNAAEADAADAAKKAADAVDAAASAADNPTHVRMQCCMLCHSVRLYAVVSGSGWHTVIL
jgi:hypothetical protein